MCLVQGLVGPARRFSQASAVLSDSLTTVEYISWVYKLSIFRTCENVGLQSARSTSAMLPQYLAFFFSPFSTCENVGLESAGGV